MSELSKRQNEIGYIAGLAPSLVGAVLTAVYSDQAQAPSDAVNRQLHDAQKQLKEYQDTREALQASHSFDPHTAKSIDGLMKTTATTISSLNANKPYNGGPGIMAAGFGFSLGFGALATIATRKVMKMYNNRQEEKHLIELAEAEERRLLLAEEFKTLEAVLKKGFQPAVKRLNLESILQLEPGKEVPKILNRYRLVALVTENYKFNTADMPGSDFDGPADITYGYRTEGTKPYLDTALTVGLAFNNKLCAVAGAAIDPETNKLIVKQVQGVITKSDNPRDKFKSGLYGGFLWRETLVQAWVEIARELDLPEIVLQAGSNNRWNTIREDRPEVYDALAQRMGFERDESSNWVMPLAA